MDIKEEILSYVEKRVYAERQDIERHVAAPAHAVQDALAQLEKDYELAVTKNGKYALASTMGLFKGTLECKSAGFGFLRTSLEEGDIFIPKTAREGALGGDEVLVKLKKNQRGGKNLEGAVVKILSPVEVTVVGRLIRRGKQFYVHADGPAMDDVLVDPPKKEKGRPDGKIVVATITRRGNGKHGPRGKITEVLGNEGDKGVDILAYARRFGLDAAFDRECMAEAAEKKGKKRSPAGRLDLRGELILTIDGADAQDLDDAISLKKLSGGQWELGVHIADVSHYVREGSALDAEALRRGTSVYMVDRVVPMLPEDLSNDLCSLHPGEDKYTLSCIMRIDKTGEVVKHSLKKSIINSGYRMTYSGVNAILEGDKALCKKYKKLVKPLRDMNALAAVLRQRREEKGSIDFDLSEAKIILDKHGFPKDVVLRERADAEKLIEEFMLRANITVAEHFYDIGMPFIYRIHEQPDADRMKELAIFLRNFGIKMQGADDIQPREIQRVLSDVEGAPEAGIVNHVTLRSLKKARYDAQPGQHFGLAAEQYCHFTSPIRRYPDLMAHRIIKLTLGSKLTTGKIEKLKKKLPEVAAQCSNRERNAIEAERAVEDLKTAEYMSRRIGEEYEGIVSGVTGFGIFVELPNTIEGMAPLAGLEDDYYVYNEKQYCVVGERTARRITLGDKARVKVVSTDVSLGKIEFELL